MIPDHEFFVFKSMILSVSVLFKEKDYQISENSR